MAVDLQVATMENDTVGLHNDIVVVEIIGVQMTTGDPIL
jgi:hypothetical protein